MGLFFHDSQSRQKQIGTQHWREEPVPTQPPILSFSLRQLSRQGVETEHQVMIDDEQMYIKHTNSTIRKLPLCLTAMEESFYLKNHKSNFVHYEEVYALKFTRGYFTTSLFTYNEEIFIQCYCFLAKYCILRNFERHFKVGKKIGEGAFAAVYEGINIRSSEKVALKVFNKERFQNGDQMSLSMLFNEIDKLERLRRYNLSPLIEVYQAQDCIILVMQKAEAGDMVSYLQLQNLHYDGNLIRTIMQQILESLSILHNAGFIHRDIKPENVLFLTKSRKSSIFLSDFGLTVNKNSELESRVGKMDAGTIGFAAPEILHNKNYDQKCDIFSAGCLFYFLNTGLNFFQTCNYTEIRYRTKDSNFIKNRIAQTDNLTDSTRDLLIKLLQVDPSLRMSAEEALNHQYFESREHLCTHPCCDDQTFRQYIQQKIRKFWE